MATTSPTTHEQDTLTGSTLRTLDNQTTVFARWWQRALRILAGEAGLWRWAIGLMVLFLAMQTVFLAASVTAGAVPNSRVLESLAVDAQRGVWDAEDFPRDGIGHVTENITFAGVSDSYTECIALTLGLSADPSQDRGPLYRALAWPHLGTCSVAFGSVASLAAGTTAEQGYTYNRYWNGSATVTRPVLAIAGVGGVRLATAVVFVAAAIFAFSAFARRSSVWVGATLLLPVFASTNILTQVLDSYPHVLMFAVALAGLGLGVLVGSKPIPAIVTVGVVAGSLLNFVDFLLNPPLAWSAFVFGVASTRVMAGDRRLRSMAIAGVAAAGGWIVGYGATWLARWAIAVSAFGESALNEILSVITERLQGQYANLVAPGLGQATIRNVELWWTTIPTAPVVLVLLAALIVLGLAILVGRGDWRGLGIAMLLSSPLIIVPIWFETLSNHSQIHSWFTYRSVPMMVGIMAAAVLVAVLSARGQRRMDVLRQQTRVDASPAEASP